MWRVLALYVEFSVCYKQVLEEKVCVRYEGISQKVLSSSEAGGVCKVSTVIHVCNKEMLEEEMCVQYCRFKGEML